ncbi:MAG TPA: NADH-quinone oxidoreductase subunit M [Candidatus Azoamicus sp. OHIO1]
MLLEMPLLSFIVWLPIISGLILFFVINDRNGSFVKNVSLLVSLATLCLCCILYIDFNSSSWEMQFVEKYQWISELGIFYNLGVDGISLPLVVLTCFMTFIVVISSYKVIYKNISQYFSYFLIMQGLVCGVFLSLDAILFYVFFEAMLIPMFLIIGIWGGNNRVYATIKFFLYTFFGSIFFLISLIYLHYVIFHNTGELTFSILTFQSSYLSIEQQKWLFWAIFVAFAIKVPMWPVHTWLPDAHVEAPTGGSVILAAITLKVGGYGIVRFLLPIVPDGCMIFSNIVIILSFIAIVYIGLVAIVQKDMKKLVAYSSISHMGFVTLGCFLLFAFNFESVYFKDAVLGIEGAMIQMISHGFISGAMFICVGILYDRMHTKLISRYGGVANSMPVFAVFFMIFSMANSGLPGTSGFVGELFVILAVFKVHFLYSLLAGTTLILGASYTLWMYKRVVFGSAVFKDVIALYDIRFDEKLVLIFLTFAVLLFGIWPAPLLDIMRSTIEHFVSQVMQSKVY